MTTPPDDELIKLASEQLTPEQVKEFRERWEAATAAPQHSVWLQPRPPLTRDEMRYLSEE